MSDESRTPKRIFGSLTTRNERRQVSPPPLSFSHGNACKRKTKLEMTNISTFAVFSLVRRFYFALLPITVLSLPSPLELEQFSSSCLWTGVAFHRFQLLLLSTRVKKRKKSKIPKCTKANDSALTINTKLFQEGPR